MPSFRIVVKDASGANSDLIREADSRGAVLRALRKEGFTPVSVESATKSTLPSWLSFLEPGGRRKPRRKDIQAFMCNFATLLRSGMDVGRALQTLARDSRGRFRETLEAMGERVRQGDRLSSAMERTRMFTSFQVKVVRAGEYGGNLAQALSRVGAAIEREAAIRARIRNAVAYPAFISVFGIVSVIIMVVAVLPRFTKLYEEMHAQLPLTTVVVLKVSSVVRGNAFWMFPLAALLMFLVARRGFRFRDNERLDRLRMKIPLVGPLVRDMGTAAFLRNLGLLVQSGIPIPEALGICAEVSNGAVFSRAARSIEEGVLGGGKLSTEFRRQKLFSETVVNLIAVGEESGSLQNLLLETSESMEKQIDDMIKGLLTLLEPALILFVGVLVGIIVMAMLLPIFSLSSSLRQ